MNPKRKKEMQGTENNGPKNLTTGGWGASKGLSLKTCQLEGKNKRKIGGKEGTK